MACVFVRVTSQLLLWDSWGSVDRPALWLLFLGQSFGGHSPERLLPYETLVSAQSVVGLLKRGQGKVSR